MTDRLTSHLLRCSYGLMPILVFGVMWLSVAAAQAQRVVHSSPQPPPFTGSSSSVPTYSSPSYSTPIYTSTPIHSSIPVYTEVPNVSSSHATPSNVIHSGRPVDRSESSLSRVVETSGPTTARSITPPATSASASTVSYPLLPRQNMRPDGWIESPYSLSKIRSARTTAMRARSVSPSTDPVAADLGIENADFIDQWADLAESYTQLAERVDAANNKLSLTQRDYDTVRQKLDQHGLTPTVGLLLRHKKEQLNEWRVQDSQSVFVNQELAQSRQQQLELDLVRYDGSEPVRQASQLLLAAGYDVNRSSRDPLTGQVQELLRQRAAWLGALQTAFQDYQQKLSELDSATSASSELTGEYRTLIDRHVTWIRSDEALSLRDARNLKGGLGALFDSRRSSDFGPTLERKITADPVGPIVMLVGIVLIGIARWRAKSWLTAIGRRQRMRKSPAEKRKLFAGILTVLVSFAIPGVFYWVGRWLGTGVVSEATLHGASAFYAASLVALLIEVPRQWMRTDGYLHQHVDIDLPRRPRAMQYVTVIGMGLVVAAYAITVMGLIDHGMWRASVARVGFILAMLLVVWTMHLAFRPIGGLLEPLIATFCGAVIHRGRFLLYLASIGFPLAMIVLSALGYGFTALEFIQKAILTSVAVMIAAILWPGVKYVSAHLWGMLTGAREDQTFDTDPLENDRYDGAESSQVVGALGEHFLELKHHLAFLCQCALVLGAIVCFGWLWIDLFPKVRLGNPVLWTVQESVQEETLNASGQSVMNFVTQETPVTVLHLVLAVATLFVAFQLAKLLPALFDALVLQRVSFDEGMEHFTLVLGRCFLFGVGCFIACKWIGVRWPTIQWLAVGLMIGLGFGLQDMVRNLFGGLIVLFEKPARLGDLITVGNFTGRVAAQRLRTTVLSDDEGREVIIPNQNFVSDDVVNWMGAGRLHVIPIEVAVTRDERPADLCRKLQELMMEQPDVLLTPSPQATLVCVGQRSQRIEVRVWIEQGQDASRYRNQLLKMVRRFLGERNLLSSTQPSQPKMNDVMTAVDENEDFFDDDFERPRLSRTIGKRKRRA